VIQRRLDEFLKEKGVSRYRLSLQTGISQGNLKKLAKGETTGIEFSVLERICKELNCQPGDLLVFVKEKVTLNGE
jgi:putative transcriptional regulator